MHFPFAFTLLAAAAVASIAAPPVVVLKGGSKYILSRPYEVRGSQARLPLANGTLVSIPVSEIDLEATRLAAMPPTPTPPSATTSATRPRQTSMSIQLSGVPKSYGSTYSGSQATTYGDSPSGSKGGPVQVRGYTRANGTYVAPHSRSAPRAGGKH